MIYFEAFYQKKFMHPSTLRGEGSDHVSISIFIMSFVVAGTSSISIFEATLAHSMAILPGFNETNPDRLGFTCNQEDNNVNL